MEDDDAEMADNGTDDADDHVPMAPAFLLQVPGPGPGPGPGVARLSSPASNLRRLAQSESREADDSSMLPLSDPE